MPTRFLPTGDNHRVTTLELLFDLVFVPAITAVSETIAHDLTTRWSSSSRSASPW